jgi:pyruvate dehydrogenase kinase 2/3/4
MMFVDDHANANFPKVMNGQPNGGYVEVSMPGGSMSDPMNGFNKVRLRVPMEKRCVDPSFLLLHTLKSLRNSTRYFAAPLPEINWPPEIRDYNSRFTRMLDSIKKRHDPTVTTVAQGVRSVMQPLRVIPV